MSLYYTLTLPEIDFVHYYIVAWLVAWYSSGLGMLSIARQSLGPSIPILGLETM